MTVRTSQRTVTFARTFSLNGLDEAHPAGTYTVQTHEESIPGPSFLAWRRVATVIFLPSRPGGAFVEQLVEIDPLDLEAVQKKIPRAPRSCSGSDLGRLSADQVDRPSQPGQRDGRSCQERPQRSFDVTTACAGKLGCPSH
jgi:hypothetical protein